MVGEPTIDAVTLSLLEIPPMLDRRRRPSGGPVPADPADTREGNRRMARAKKQAEEDLPLEKRLKGYLVTTVIGWLKQQKKVYADLDEDTQRDVISSIDDAFAQLINEAVTTIAKRDFPAVHGTLESLAIKDGVKASVKLLRDVETVAQLGSKTGSTVMVVLAEPRDFFGGSIPKPDPMQRPLMKDDAPEDPDAA